jgi:hypothetical protein
LTRQEDHVCESKTLYFSTEQLLVCFRGDQPRCANNAWVLPKDLRLEIASKYPGKKIVTLSGLEEDDRAFFQKYHGDDGTGLVNVDFYGDGNPTLALVLITK